MLEAALAAEGLVGSDLPVLSPTNGGLLGSGVSLSPGPGTGQVWGVSMVMEMEAEISQQQIPAVMGNHLPRGWGIKGSRQGSALFAGVSGVECSERPR